MNTNNKIDLWRHALNPISGFRPDFESLFDNWLAPAVPEWLRTNSQFAPACEVEDQGDHYLLILEMAGVKKDDIKMEITNDSQIVISGERRGEIRKKGDGQNYSERRFGKFQRVFALPTG